MSQGRRSPQDLDQAQLPPAIVRFESTRLSIAGFHSHHDDDDDEGIKYYVS